MVVNGRDLNLKTTEVFDAELNLWKCIAATKKPRAFHALVAAEDSLLAFGDNNNRSLESLSSVERLHNLNSQWREAQSINAPRCTLAAVVCRKFIYAFGGYTTNVGNSVEKYDIGSNTWTDVRSMNVKRPCHAACVLQGKIFVVASYNVADIIQQTIESYDPTLDEWTIIGETEHECVNHAVVELYVGLCYLGWSTLCIAKRASVYRLHVS